MDRGSFLRSLPYLHPSTWPAPSSIQSSGGTSVRKLIFPSHVVSIEPVSSATDNSKSDSRGLGPAFFRGNGYGCDDDNNPSGGNGPTYSLDEDPALCHFEVSVLVPKSTAGVSPGASSASTAITMSQSPNTPAARKVTALVAAAASAPPSTSKGLFGLTKDGADSAICCAEPVLYFRFGQNDGTYCVDYSRILDISLDEGEHEKPPSVLVAFDTCCFRIFRLGATSDKNKDDKQSQEEQLKYLRLIVNELTASLRVAGPFVAPPLSSPNSKDSADTENSDRVSLEDGGQPEIGESSSSDVKGQGHSSGTGMSDSQQSQESLASTDKGEAASSTFGQEQLKRRRVAYDQSVAAIGNIQRLADPLNNINFPRRRRLEAKMEAETHLSGVMTAAAVALTACYGCDNKRNDGQEVERVLSKLDGAMSDFFPVHSRMKNQRGGNLSMSSPHAPPAKRDTSSSNVDTTHDSRELRNSARKLMEEYKNTIVARHKLAVLPSR